MFKYVGGEGGASRLPRHLLRTSVPCAPRRPPLPVVPTAKLRRGPAEGRPSCPLLPPHASQPIPHLSHPPIWPPAASPAVGPHVRAYAWAFACACSARSLSWPMCACAFACAARASAAISGAGFKHSPCVKGWRWWTAARAVSAAATAVTRRAVGSSSSGRDAGELGGGDCLAAAGGGGSGGRLDGVGGWHAVERGHVADGIRIAEP
jgi:hypothetical protein